MITFEHLLEAYLLRTETLDSFSNLDDARQKREILRDMMRRYPEHADALMDFAATETIIAASDAICLPDE